MDAQTDEVDEYDFRNESMWIMILDSDRSKYFLLWAF